MQVTKRLFETEMRESFASYALETIADRALPDARDGLKPVQRRILYAMHELGLAPDKPHRKSARIVGDVIGKYHPHGDASVYEAMVRMAQDFSMRYPLVDDHGNFGSIDGDPAAAMRYTEARLSPHAMLMLEDLEVVAPMKPNFDDSLTEPEILPAKLPNLLLNGTSGIAVGISTLMVPHHGKEVLEALIALLENPDAPIETIIRGPDFPTGGVVVNPEDWPEIVRTGKGKIAVRSRHVIEQGKKASRLVFTDVPFQARKTKVLADIVALAEKVDGILDIRDESGKEGIRIVVEVKPGDEERVLDLLFRHTALETVIHVQNQVLIGGKPVVAGLKELLQVFTRHRLEMLQKKLEHDLARETERFHILEGLSAVLKDVGRAVAIIKGSRNTDAARFELMKAFGMTEPQANAVLDLRLARLTSLEIREIEKKRKELSKRIKFLQGQLKDLKGTLKAEWEALMPLFAEPRRTEILSAKPPRKARPIQQPAMRTVCLFTRDGKAKRVQAPVGAKILPQAFRMDLAADGEEPEILVLTKKGMAIRFRTEELPVQGKTAGGVKAISLAPGDEVLQVFAVRPETQIAMETEDGRKKTAEAGEVPLTHRGGKGIKSFAPTYPKGGALKKTARA